ncbi:MAG: hypothetical protein J6C67_02340 [Muribaculaceae bacterium]|nr:hypothetical protein [Muribaculaceae bacterium]
MKKSIVIGLMALMIAGTSCKNREAEEQARQAQAMAEASREELADAVADRDQLLGLVNEISSDMQEIKRLENILTVNNQGETPSQRDQIRADIASIQQTLQQRREQLNELEQRLNRSNLNNSNLQATVTSLRQQLDGQATEIAQLRTNLEEARTTIGNLDATVDSLNRTVTDVTADRDSAATAAIALADELNTCYYAIGTKDELKERHIIETGFLRRTRLMEGQFDHTFFTRADKRTLPSIDLNSRSARVLTNQPADSYRIIDANGHKVLQITNPALFWSLSNYLVIQID